MFTYKHFEKICKIYSDSQKPYPTIVQYVFETIDE